MIASNFLLKMSQGENEETCCLGEGPPTAFSMGFDVGYEPLVLFLGPSSLVCVSLLTTWRPTHSIKVVVVLLRLIASGVPCGCVRGEKKDLGE